MILSILPKSEFEENAIIGIFLFQYIPKLYRLLPLIAGQTPTGFIFESAWSNFIINLLTFILAGHAVGSFWYLAGLQVSTTFCNVFTTPSGFIDSYHVCIVRELTNACYKLGILRWMNVDIL